jgi:hypothetical protein
MGDLTESIEKFCSRFGRGGMDLGRISLRVPEPVTFPGQLSTSSELTLLYSSLELNDNPTIGGEFFFEFYSLDKLEQAQYGWRWISIGRNEYTEDPHWNAAWTIFGNRNDDVLIADTGDPGTPVLGSIQKRTFRIADSLAEYIDVISDCMACEEESFGFDTKLEDMSVKPEFLTKIESLITKKLAPKNVDGFMDFFFG